MDAATSLGCDTVPDFPHMWRTSGPDTSDAMIYAVDMCEEFSSAALCSLSDCGGNPIRQFEGLRPAFTVAQDLDFRKMVPRIEFAHVHRKSFPAQYPGIVRILDQGDRAHYSRGGAGQVPRVRGLPYNQTYNQTQSEHSGLISE